MCDPQTWVQGVDGDPVLKPIARRVAHTAATIADDLDQWPIVPAQSTVATALEVTRQYVGKSDGWRALVYRGWFTEVSGGTRFTCPEASDG